MAADDKNLVLANVALWIAQVLYTVSPIDLVPDFLPLIGQADDALGLLLAVAFTAYTVWRVRRRGAQHALVDHEEEEVSAYQPVPVEELKRW